MEIAVALGLGGWILLIVGALVFGAIAQFVGETRTDFEWVPAALAAAVGGLAASEFLVAWRTVEPVWDGLALVPALIGGLVVGIAVDVIARLSTGGTYTSRPISA